jgi:hypothetical protein
MNTSPFLAFGDESGTFSQRYQSVAVISGPASILEGTRRRLLEILASNGVDELKFTRVARDSSRINTADAFIHCVVEEYCQTIRIDTLTWDTQDTRHSVAGRDDRRNLEIMYFRVLLHMAKQWNVARWRFYPDVQSCVDWERLRAFLEGQPLAQARPEVVSLIENIGDANWFTIVDLTPSNSGDEPLIQLADLFAGVARFSRETCPKCLQWIEQENRRDQLTFLEPKPLLKSTQTEENRFRLISKIDALCKGRKLGVSLRNRGYLWTPQPSNPIDFWHYQPQHEDDKAPIKRHRRE